MTKYRVRVAQTHYYDVVVSAAGVAEARRKAKEWAAKAPQQTLDEKFFEAGPFEPGTTGKLKNDKTPEARK